MGEGSRGHSDEGPSSSLLFEALVADLQWVQLVLLVAAGFFVDCEYGAKAGHPFDCLMGLGEPSETFIPWVLDSGRSPDQALHIMAGSSWTRLERLGDPLFAS